MKIIISILILLCVFQAKADEEIAVKDPVLFYVNDEAITENTFSQFYQSRGYKIPADKDEQKLQQAQVANELINIVLLGKQATLEKLDQSYEVQNALELSRKNILSKALIAKCLEKINVTDKDREEAYKQILKESENRSEYKTRYMTLNTAEEAQKAIQQLKKGETFDKVAQRYSKEKFANLDDTKLGWVTAESQEKEIGDAMRKMDAGKFSEEPVKTRFGWHVILVDEKRKPQIPPESQMQAKLTDLIKKQKLREQVAELRKKATIKTATRK